MARERTERLGERTPAAAAPKGEPLAEARPRKVGELLDLSTDVLLSRFGLLFGLAFLVTAGSMGLVILLDHLLARPEGELSLSQILFDSGMLELTIQMVSTAIIGVFSVKITLKALLGDAVPTRSIWAAVPMAMVVTLISTFLTIVVGVFTLFLGMIVLLYKFLFAEIVIVTEKVGPLRALARSWELTKGSFGRCTAVVIGGSLMLFPLQMAAIGLATPEGHDWLLGWAPTLTPTVAEIVLLLLAALLTALPTALLGVVRAVLYTDTLIRREGVDLDARLSARIAQRRSDEPPPAPSGPIEELI